LRHLPLGVVQEDAGGGAEIYFYRIAVLTEASVSVLVSVDYALQNDGWWA
jgi:hypothetical protein